MRRIKVNYYALQVLKNARHKLRKAIVSNCNKELLNSICECVVNVLNGNIRISDCTKRKLRKFQTSLRSLVDERLPLVSMRRVILQRGGFLLPLLSAVLPALDVLFFRQDEQAIMTLLKMYLVPAAAYDARRPRSQPPPQTPPVKTKRATKISGRTASQHPHDNWGALRKKLLEADFTEADLMHPFAEFLRKVLPVAGLRACGGGGSCSL